MSVNNELPGVKKNQCLQHKNSSLHVYWRAPALSLAEMSRVCFGSADNHESFCALENWNSGTWTDIFSKPGDQASLWSLISLLKNCFLIFPVNTKESWSFTARPTSQNILSYKLTANKSKFQILAFFFFVEKMVPQSKNRVILYYYKRVFRVVQRTVKDVAEILNLKVY